MKDEQKDGAAVAFEVGKGEDRGQSTANKACKSRLGWGWCQVMRAIGGYGDGVDQCDGGKGKYMRNRQERKCNNLTLVCCVGGWQLVGSTRR